MQRVKEAPARRVASPSAANRNTVAAVNRAVDVLLAFRLGESDLSLAQLARRTGMYKSTILRLLQTLEARSFVTRLPGGGYRLGAALLHLGMIYQKSFRLQDIVTPQLAALTEITGESASYFVSDGNARLCLFRNEPRQIVRHTVEVGEPLPMGRGASGRVLITFSAGAAGVDRRLFRQLPVESIGTNPLDISTIAGPVFGIDGALTGAVAISGPSSRFEAAARKRAAKALIGALRTLTSRLGGDPDVFVST